MTAGGAADGSAAVRVRLDTEEAPAGEVAAVVRVVDDTARDRGRLALRARTAVPLRLPRPGRYVLIGRTPSGTELSAEIDTAAAPREVRVTATRPTGPAASGPDTAPPVRLYGKGGRGAAYEPAPRPSPAPPTRQGCVLEAPGPEGLNVLTVVPEGGEVVLTPLSAAGAPGDAGTPGVLGWAARPAPGTAWTLLCHLHQADLEGAAAVADAVIEACGPSPSDVPDPLTALAVGQLLLRTSDPRRVDWIAALVTDGRHRTDAWVLAWELARHTPGSDALAAAHEARWAAHEAPPLLADSQERLLRCLDWTVRVTGVRAYAADRDRERLRRYAAVPGVLTAYTGRGPLDPVPADDSPIADGTLADDAPAVRSGRTALRVTSPPGDAAGPAPRGALRMLIGMPRSLATVADRDTGDPEAAERRWSTADGLLSGSLLLLSGQQALLTITAAVAEPPAGTGPDVASDTDTDWEGPARMPLVTVHAPTGAGPITLLVALGRDTDSTDVRPTGEVVVPVGPPGQEVTIVRELRRVDELTQAEAEAIGRSFPASSERVRNLWRAAARALPEGHPARAAVLAAALRLKSGNDGP
ncbi:hypothetical protein OG749_08875 [Streptomyces nojiriensis]|uniref:hypothetical protein n=1 Tax=Streptomyces nojiriensis TaxID=66374 RepID=UPI002E17C780